MADPRVTLNQAIEKAGNVSQLARALGYTDAQRKRLGRMAKGTTQTVDAEVLADAERYLSKIGQSVTDVDSGETEAPSSAGDREGHGVVYDPNHVPEGFTVVHYARHGHGAGIGRDNGDTPVQVLVPTAEVERVVGSDQPGPITKSFAAGPSMEPWIGDGEAIWYIPFGNFVDGARYALWIDGGDGDVVKRVYRRGDTLILKSDNRKIDPLTVTALKAIDDYCDENVYADEAGRKVRIEFRGRVVYPFDRAPAVLAELAEFARSLMKD